MSIPEPRSWQTVEVAHFLRLIEENRSIGEMSYLLSRSEAELKEKCGELERKLPREYDTEFLLRVRHPTGGPVRDPGLE